MNTLLTTVAIACAGAMIGAQETAPGKHDRQRQEHHAVVDHRPHQSVDHPPHQSLVRAPLESKVVKGAPYSAEVEIESIQMLADGNRIVHRTTGRVYRDSAGRIRREEDRPSGQPAISIFDPEAGLSYSLDVERRLAWSTPTPATTEILKKAEALRRAQHTLKHAQETMETSKKVKSLGGGDQTDAAKVRGAGHMTGPRKGPVPSEQREEGLPARTIEGVRAEGIRRTSMIPAGGIGNDLPIKIVSEEWISPDLQLLVMTQHNDPRVGESSYRMLNIVRAEPNQFLFQVPSDYTIKKSEIHKFERR